MNVSEPGVLRDSAAYFHTCSALAKKMFFYPLCTGRYRCDGTYRVERTHYDSFLVMYVARGSGYWSSGGQEIPVPEGSLLFLDCYRPHCYGTRSGWEIYWLHFHGVLARPYFEAFAADGAFLMQSDAAVCVRSVRKIFESFDRRCPVSEPMISKRINDLLTGAILASQQEKKQLKRLGAIDESVQFIAEHVEQPLTLEQLAASVSLSPFYFARLFKQETGFSPHEYIVRARLDKAKYLLISTSLPLKEIACRCGFGNECSFSTLFKKMSGCTPRGYRMRGMEAEESPETP